MVAGGAPPCPFTVASVHPVYMYKRKTKRSINYIDSLS
jgi:hypothetical protein